MKPSAKLEEMGVTRIKYYYQSNPLVGNVFTACLFLDKNNNILARGICIKSVLDEHDKFEARNKSYKRAMTALFGKNDSGPINPDNRWYYSIQRKMKLNTLDNASLYANVIEPAFKEFEIEGFKLVTAGKHPVVYYPISMNFPISETKKLFNYKSMYCPNPTEFEKQLLNK